MRRSFFGALRTFGMTSPFLDTCMHGNSNDFFRPVKSTSPTNKNEIQKFYKLGLPKTIKIHSPTRPKIPSFIDSLRRTYDGNDHRVWKTINEKPLLTERWVWIPLNPLDSIRNGTKEIYKREWVKRWNKKWPRHLNQHPSPLFPTFVERDHGPTSEIGNSYTWWGGCVKIA